jgi:hypothetical protein
MNTIVKKPFVITPVYDLLLRGSQDMPIGLYHLHLETADQLTTLHYKPGMLKTVKKRLKLLADNEYVQADSIPTKRFKSPYYYTLDNRGMRYFESIGFDTDAAFRPSKEVSESYLHLKLTLELNDVFIAALRLKQFSNGNCYVARRLDERSFKRQPLTYQYNSATIRLIPDGFLDIRVRRRDKPDLSLVLLLEHDRGTEQQEHFKRRIRMYKYFLGSEAYKQLLNTNSVTVAFTTFISARRVQQMREWAKAELAAEPQLAGLFIFTELPAPLEPQHLLFERCWYTLSNDQPIALLGE